jgi:hypothetical protein
MSRGQTLPSLLYTIIQCVPLATESDISLIILTPMKILQQNTHTLQTHFISHTTNVLLFKFRCNIFIGVSSVASGTPCTSAKRKRCKLFSMKKVLGNMSDSLPPKSSDYYTVNDRKVVTPASAITPGQCALLNRIYF